MKNIIQFLKWKYEDRKAQSFTMTMLVVGAIVAILVILLAVGIAKKTGGYADIALDVM